VIDKHRSHCRDIFVRHGHTYGRECVTKMENIVDTARGSHDFYIHVSCRIRGNPTYGNPSQPAKIKKSFFCSPIKVIVISLCHNFDWNNIFDFPRVHRLDRHTYQIYINRKLSVAIAEIEIFFVSRYQASIPIGGQTKKTGTKKKIGIHNE